jgi:hypothetical protein
MEVRRILIERVVVTVPMADRDATMDALDGLGYDFVRVGPVQLRYPRVDASRARMVYERIHEDADYTTLDALTNEEAPDA